MTNLTKGRTAKTTLLFSWNLRKKKGMHLTIVALLLWLIQVGIEGFLSYTGKKDSIEGVLYSFFESYTEFENGTLDPDKESVSQMFSSLFDGIRAESSVLIGLFVVSTLASVFLSIYLICLIIDSSADKNNQTTPKERIQKAIHKYIPYVGTSIMQVVIGLIGLCPALLYFGFFSSSEVSPVVFGVLLFCGILFSISCSVYLSLSGIIVVYVGKKYTSALKESYKIISKDRRYFFTQIVVYGILSGLFVLFMLNGIDTLSRSLANSTVSYAMLGIASFICNVTVQVFFGFLFLRWIKSEQLSSLQV